MSENRPSKQNQLPAIVPQAVEVIRSPVIAARPAQRASKQPIIDARLVLHALARWWKLALPAGVLLGAAAGAAAFKFHVPRYQSNAFLYVQADAPFVAFRNNTNSQRFIDTQLDMIRSPVILQDVLFRPEIAKLPEIQAAVDRVAWVTSSMRVSASHGSDLVRIEMMGTDPDGVAKIVNAIAAEFVSKHRQEDRANTDNLIKLLDDEQRKREAELKRLQDEVGRLAKDATGEEAVLIGDGDKGIAISSRIAAYQQNLVSVEAERAILDWTRRKLDTEFKENKIEVSEADVEANIESSPGIQKLMADVDAARIALEPTRKAAPNNRPALDAKQTEVDAAQGLVDDAKASLREEYTTRLRDNLQGQREDALAEMESQAKQLESLEEFYSKKLKEEREEAAKRGNHTLDLEFKRAEMERAEAVFKLIADRITALTTEQYAPSRVEIEREAEPAALPINDKSKNVAMAVLVALFAPFGLAVLWEIKVRRISSADQMEALSQIPILGEVPTLPAQSLLPGRRARERFDRQRATFEESIASLRTCQVLSDDNRKLQVIAVASAVSREGKTSIAAQLASSLASSVSDPVLLIDGDLRDPDIHELFDVPLGPGLVAVLAGECNVFDAVTTAKSSPVRLLPAGRLQQSPHSLFGSGQFTRTIDELRDHYRYIVVDCPPLLSASESLIVAKVADGAILCTMRDHCRSAQLMQAKHRLSMAGVEFLGAVLNGVPTESYASRYGGYYDSRYAKK